MVGRASSWKLNSTVSRVDTADENSQSLEMYDAMRKTKESEREAKDQITEQANKYARNGGRRYREPSESPL